MATGGALLDAEATGAGLSMLLAAEAAPVLSLLSFRFLAMAVERAESGRSALLYSTIGDRLTRRYCILNIVHNLPALCDVFLIVPISA